MWEWMCPALQALLRPTAGLKHITEKNAVILVIFNVLTNPLHGANLNSLKRRDSAEFSFRSIIDSVSPLISPGTNKCEALKNMFGISYEQMLAKNATSALEYISLDYITKEETIKYNITSTQSLNKLVEEDDNIVVFVHGFMESSDGMMVQALVPEFSKLRHMKLFALDGREVIKLEYFRSSTYARFMGELLGAVLTNFIEDGQDPAKIHLIGHSLGSHIAGRAGKQVRDATGKLIGRITGLDPAGPCFSTVGPEERLDQTDAAFVDVIHTNAGVLGIEDPIGHKDFYPNGGKSQPGCYFYICDHSRAWELFAQSINSHKTFPARKCENWTMFKDGRCRKHELTHLGYHSSRGSGGIYFLSTGPSSPYNLGAAGSA